MFLSELLSLAACTPGPKHVPWPPVQPEVVVDDTSADSGLQVSYKGPAYEACVADAECGPDSDCTNVPGYAGNYWALPNVDGPDCPEESSCFGGDYIGIEDGICLPWCDDLTCPATACTTCHALSGPPVRNAHGLALAAVRTPDTDLTDDLARALLAIEDLASDGDGPTNLEELFTGSEPGFDSSDDPECSQQTDFDNFRDSGRNVEHMLRQLIGTDAYGVQ